MKRILLYDLETSGLPVTAAASYKDTTNWPAIIQIAWELFTEDGETLDTDCALIQPNGWTIPEHSQFHREHGYTMERLEKEGVPIIDALERLRPSWLSADIISSHNLSFDRPILFATLYKHGLDTDFKHKVEWYCTKLATEPILKLPGFKGKYKWPTLTEAHQFFFGEGFDGAHDALADVQAAKRVYLECRKYEGLEDIL